MCFLKWVIESIIDLLQELYILIHDAELDVFFWNKIRYLSDFNTKLLSKNYTLLLFYEVCDYEVFKSVFQMDIKNWLKNHNSVTIGTINVFIKLLLKQLSIYFSQSQFAF